MRVLLGVHALPTDTLGGTELYTRDLAETLARDHDVAVAAPRRTDTRIDRAAVHGLPANGVESGLGGAVDGDVAAAFADLLDGFDPDVVHLQHLKGLSASLPALCASRGIPSVLTLHDFWTICHREQLYRPEGRPCGGPDSTAKCTDCYAAAAGDGAPDQFYRRAVERRKTQLDDALATTDLLVAPSTFLRETFVAHGTPPEAIVRRRNGIRVGRFRDAGFDGSEPLDVGYAGRITELKGVHLLVEAFEDVTGARLRVFGSFDPDADDYHARLRAMAGPNVEFRGRYDDPPEPYAASDVIVVPSLWYENSPLVIQEAFASGVPVVAANAGGMAELVSDGVDGLTFERGNAGDLSATLQRLADSPDLVSRLREGTSEPKRLTDHAAEIAALYRRLV